MTSIAINRMKRRIKWFIHRDYTGCRRVIARLDLASGRVEENYILHQADWDHCPNKQGLLSSVIKHLEYHVTSRLVGTEAETIAA